MSLTAWGARAEEAGGHEKKWTLAAVPFDLAQSRDFSVSENSLAQELPSLVLGYLSGGLLRVPDEAEVLDRNLHELREERKSLFLQISSETKKRDSHVLGNYSERELKFQVRESEKKIGELKKSLDANLRQAEKISGEIGLELAEAERVQLYEGDPQKLLSFGAGEDEGKIGSYGFSQKVVSQKINGVLAGTLTLYGEYVSCSAEVFVFPGGRAIARAGEVGSVDNLAALAQGIAAQISPAITAQLPVELFFSVSPEEALATASLAIDDVVYTEIPEKVTVSSGIHSVAFSADGFASAGTTYAFTGDAAFKIEAVLEPSGTGAASLRLRKAWRKNILDGTIYANAEKVGEISEEASEVSIAINGKAVLGQFVTADGSAALFYVPQKILSDGAALSVKVNAYDRSAMIEKRRKRTYLAYSVFMISLLPYFYTYGNFIAERNALYADRGNYETAVKWQTASWVTAGISIGTGVVWAYQLVRYLVEANKVLPARAK